VKCTDARRRFLAALDLSAILCGHPDHHREILTTVQLAALILASFLHSVRRSTPACSRLRANVKIDALERQDMAYTAG